MRTSSSRSKRPKRGIKLWDVDGDDDDENELFPIEDLGDDDSSTVNNTESSEHSASDLDKEDEESGTDSSASKENDGNIPSLPILLDELEHRYSGDERPEFCIREPSKLQRQVRLTDTELLGVLIYKKWRQGAYGYWTLTDTSGNEHIVRHEKGRYYPWQGEAYGFSDIALAQTVPIRAGQDPNPTPSIEDSADTVSVRTFRPRTLRQEQPYKMYQAQRKLEQQGVQLTESEVEQSLVQQCDSSASQRKTSVRLEPQRKRKRSSDSPQKSTTESTRSKSMLGSLRTSNSRLSPISDETYTSRTILRTRLNRVDGPAVAILLKNIHSSNDLFAKLQQKWAFKLENSQIAYYVVRFDWLGDDRTILMQEDDEDGFSLMMEEIRQAPGRKKDDQVMVSIEVHTT